jgi:hypothetical protein
MQYREIYLPWNLMKFTTVQNKLTESTNKIYAYCDFSHFYTKIAGLSPSLTNLTNYGSLLSRVTGSLFKDMWEITSCISENEAAGNFNRVGQCYGDLIGIIFDTQL